MEEKNIPKSLHNFTLEEFRRSVDAMIATSPNAYKSSSLRGITTPIQEYTPERLKEVIERGTIEQQQRLSYNYFLMDGLYRRIIIYYATLLKYAGILIPDIAAGHSIKENGIAKKYNQALGLVDRINIPNLCIEFMTRALVYGSYFGVIQTLDKKNFAVIDLPTKYCSSKYKDVQNNDIIEFDLFYFDSIQDKDQREQALSTYPEVFRVAYNAYKRNVGNRYFQVPSEIGICFPMYDGRPFFISSIPEIVNYRQYEALEKEKDSDAINKILIQEIDHLSDGTLVFEPEEVEEMHRGTVEMLRGNPRTSVITSYGRVSLADAKVTGETVSKNNLEKIAQSVYRSFGLSSQLFGASGNIALSTSLQNDLAFVMSMAAKFSVFFTNIVNRLYANSAISFKYQILPVSYYNEKEYVDNAYKEATVGYSFFLPAIAMGMSQKDLVNIKTVENDLLDLGNLLIPLKTSFNDGGEEAGRPQKSDTDKSDKTIRNIEGAGNE